MIDVINGLPDHVAAFRATGKVHKEDYNKIVIPVVDAVAKKYGKIDFLLVLETGIGNYSAGAFMDDALVTLKHFTQWRKVAVVSNEAAVKKMTDVLGHLLPGKTKGFLLTEVDAAMNWVSE